jgi:hypothetical protein
MSQRRETEDKYTVRCKECKREIIYPEKKPNQKWLPSGECPFCAVTPLKCTKCGARGTIRAAFDKHVDYTVKTVTKEFGVEIRFETEDCYDSNLIHIACSACNTYWSSTDEFLNNKPQGHISEKR